MSISILPSWCIVDIDSMALSCKYWVDCWLGNFRDEYVDIIQNIVNIANVNESNDAFVFSM
jgi:hypothetical protein